MSLYISKEGMPNLSEALLSIQEREVLLNMSRKKEQSWKRQGDSHSSSLKANLLRVRMSGYSILKNTIANYQ